MSTRHVDPQLADRVEQLATAPSEMLRADSSDLQLTLGLCEYSDELSHQLWTALLRNPNATDQWWVTEALNLVATRYRGESVLENMCMALRSTLRMRPVLWQGLLDRLATPGAFDGLNLPVFHHFRQQAAPYSRATNLGVPARDWFIATKVALLYAHGTSQVWDAVMGTYWFGLLEGWGQEAGERQRRRMLLLHDPLAREYPHLTCVALLDEAGWPPDCPAAQYVAAVLGPGASGSVAGGLGVRELTVWAADQLGPQARVGPAVQLVQDVLGRGPGAGAGEAIPGRELVVLPRTPPPGRGILGTYSCG